MCSPVVGHSRSVQTLAVHADIRTLYFYSFGMTKCTPPNMAEIVLPVIYIDFPAC